ncbi:MAG: hypothetical protein ACFFDN_37800 [Candidatus Hodarchaeota archaeon]
MNQQNLKISVFFILFGLFFNIPLISLNNSLIINHQNNEYEDLISLELASSLKYSDIYQNATTIYRLFESINFTIDTSTDFSEANYTIMQISFRNGSVIDFNMDSVDVNKFYYDFKPEFDSPLGLQNVTFFIYSENGTLLNDQPTYTNFTIDTNCAANFIPDPDYNIGDLLDVDLFICNFSSNNKDYDFLDWDITVVDSTKEATQKNLLGIGNNIKQVMILIDNETFRDINKIYYLKLNMTELNRGTVSAAYFPFNIKNSNPKITSIIELSPNEVFRTDEFIVSINATDLESVAENLTTTVLIQDSQGNDVFEEALRYRNENLFSDRFTIPSYNPIGNYRVNVTVRDEHGGFSSKVTYLIVKNNVPKIHSYTINGQSMNQSISVQYGRDLVFSFNVSDVEGVAYITVALIDENNEWFNITRAYAGEETKITIRTIELITGTWFVYIYVIDSDGAVTSLIDDYNMAPQGIKIIPDVLSNFLPWIVFFFGIIIGFLVGVGIIYRYFKSKFVEFQTPLPKKQEILPKKKAKAKPIKEEEEILEKEELKVDEEEKEEVPKRKIKRKL